MKKQVLIDVACHIMENHVIGEIAKWDECEYRECSHGNRCYHLRYSNRSSSDNREFCKNVDFVSRYLSIMTGVEK